MQWIRCVAVILTVGASACEAPVDGELSIEPADGRSAIFAPRECADGAQIGYFGVELRDDDERVLEFFRDEPGRPGLVFYAPGGGAFELGPDECERFEGELLREFNPVTDNGKVEGYLTVDCRSATGWHVEGTLWFEDCRAPGDDEDCDDS